MIQRPLGRTGILVSEIAFGGVEIGMPYGIGVKGQEDMISKKEAVKLLHAAIDSGINFFDTARLYGKSEDIIGRAFKDRRDKAVVSTKCTHLRDSGGNFLHNSQIETVIKSSLAESLKTLKTDYVDVFMLHTADEEILDNDEIAHTFSELKQSGAVRAIGVSTYLPRETEKAIEKGIWDVIQLPFNLLDQRQKALFSAVSKKDIGIIVRSVLMKGLLSDRGRDLHPALKAVEQHIQSYQKLLNSNTPDLPALAVKFALSFEEVSSILVGIDRMEYLDKSLKSGNGIYLDKAGRLKACELAYPNPEFLNLHTWSQKGWLK